MAIQVTAEKEIVRARVDRLKCQGQRVAFVPTMGYLHRGHLSLMEIARKHADFVVVSIFINPTQFGPGEDLDSYPRDLDRDLACCREIGVDLVYTPSEESLYAEGFETYVRVTDLPEHLCGLSRPRFFAGVATVVCKLFNIVNPHVAVFGEKDYQQLLVIRRMTTDLDFPITVIGAPIVREPDGLAMSSRNAYLSPEQRPAALSLYQTLNEAKSLLAAGEKRAETLIHRAEQTIHSHPETDIDYISICDTATLENMETINGSALMALAVRVGTTRLIDNMVLHA